MKIKKIPLLAQIIAAIILGVICGMLFPEWLSRIFATINGIFSNLLSFIIPLLILGLIAPGIADVGKNAGRLLAATAAVAYLFTLFSGFFTFFVCEQIYPSLIGGESLNAIEQLVLQAGGNICGRMTILAEGDAQDRDDLIYLEKLPLFDTSTDEIKILGAENGTVVAY